MKNIICLAATMVIVTSYPQIGIASETDVVAVKITRESGNGAKRFRFDVKLKHADTGWDHYADKWQIIAPDGTILGTRVLAHPHVNEQPFTRSLGGVEIGEDVKEVKIQASDNLGNEGGKTMKVVIPD